MSVCVFYHETCHSVTIYFMKKDSKLCCNSATPVSIHIVDEDRHLLVSGFIFGVN